jgi:glutamate-1-semialdehyde 2,1-aminomutase
MSELAPLGPVYQAGTLSGNPLATAAGLAVLQQLDADAYQQLSDSAEQLAMGLRSAFAAAGVEAVVPKVGPLLGLFFGNNEVFGGSQPRDFSSAAASVALGQYPAFFQAMLARGIALAPGPYEVIFPSLAHSENDLRITIEAAHEAAQVVASLETQVTG